MPIRSERYLLFFLFFIILVNFAIPAWFIKSPLGLGLEADSLDYRIPMIKYFLKTLRYPDFPWTYVDDFPAFADVLMTALASITKHGYRLFAVLSYIYFAIICYQTGRLILNPLWTCFGTIQIITASAVNAQDNAVMIDLFAGALYVNAIYFILRRYLKADLSTKSTGLIGLFLGLTFSTRYTHIVSIVCTIPLLFLLEYLFSKMAKNALLFSIKVASIIFLCYSPFFFRNLYLNANPFYPLFVDIIGGKYFNLERHHEIFGMVGGYGHGRTFIDFILLPIRFAFDKGAFDYSVGPLLLMYLPVLGTGAVIALTANKENFKINFSASFGLFAFLALFYLIFWFVISRHARFLYHFYPLFVFASLLVITSLLRGQKAYLLNCFLAFFLVFSLAGTYKHLKKHNEERSGEAYLKVDRSIADWANQNLDKSKKIIFTGRTGMVYLFENEFIFMVPHIYATSYYDYRLQNDSVSLKQRLKQDAAGYLYSSNCNPEYFKDLKQLFKSKAGGCIYELL